jgi:hypothetical protein
MNDIELGRQALKYFHDRSLLLWGNTYKVSSVDALINLWPEKKRNIYLEGIGLAISVNNMSDFDVRSAMQLLAQNAKGNIPADHQSYTKYLGGQAGSINFLDLTATVAKETAIKVVEGAQAVGDQLIATGKILNFLLPVAIIYSVYQWYSAYLPKSKKK